MKKKLKPPIEALFLALALALAAAGYLPSFNAGWHFDDLQHIVNNPAVHAEEVSLQALEKAATESYLKNRPLAYVSFAVDHARGGLVPANFHLTNLVLHLGAVVLVWLLLRTVFLGPPLIKTLPWPRAAALAGAAVFAVHPLQTQGVTYIVQRMNLIASVCVLAALLAGVMFARSDQPPLRRWIWAGVFIVCALTGLLAKENAANLFILALVMDRCLSETTFKQWLRARWPLLAGALVVLIVVAVVFSIRSGGLFSGYKLRDFTWDQRLITQPRVIVMYVLLWLFPAHHLLTIDHQVVTSTGPLAPWTTAPAILIILVPTALAFIHARRAPLVSLGWLWLIAGLALESSVLPLEMAFEHRMYLPMIGLGMIAADLAARARLDRKALPLLVAAILLLALSTYRRNLVWENTVTLWSDAVMKAPDAPRPWVNLCVGAIEFEQIEEGERFCENAIERDPDSGAAWYNLGLGLFRQKRYRESEQALSKALQYDDRPWAETYYQIGRARARQGNYDGALEALEKALELDEGDPAYWYQLGLIRMMKRDPQGGCEAFQKARLLIRPDQPEMVREIDYAIKRGCP